MYGLSISYKGKSLRDKSLLSKVFNPIYDYLKKYH